MERREYVVPAESALADHRAAGVACRIDRGAVAAQIVVVLVGVPDLNERAELERQPVVRAAREVHPRRARRRVAPIGTGTVFGARDDRGARIPGLGGPLVRPARDVQPDHLVLIDRAVAGEAECAGIDPAEWLVDRERE